MKKFFSITILFLSLVVSIQLRAQKLFSKPKNPSEFAGRILAQQKSWQQLQLPKNSVQYQLNPPVNYTYTFGKAAPLFSYSIHIPDEKTPDAIPFYAASKKSYHPYIKYYLPYKGKLRFDKQVILREHL